MTTSKPMIAIMMAVLLLNSSIGTQKPTDSSKVVFFSGSWSDLMKISSQEKKPILIDFYTTWCGPCKDMDREAFHDSIVADRINEKFIAYKVNAEKGEGVTLAKQFNVHAYPSLVFTDEKGNMVYRSIGYYGISSLLKNVSIGYQSLKDTKPLAVWETEYASNSRNKAFLRNFIDKKTSLGLDCTDALEDYCKLLSSKQLTDQVNIQLFVKSVATANSVAFKTLFTYLDTEKEVDVDFKNIALIQMSDALSNDYEEAIYTKDETRLNKYLTLHKKFYSRFYKFSNERINTQVTHRRQDFYRKTHNFEKYKLIGSNHAKKWMEITDDSLYREDEKQFRNFEKELTEYPDSIRQIYYARLAPERKKVATNFLASDLNEVATTYLVLGKNRADWVTAIPWSIRSVRANPKSSYLRTLAQLYYKVGRKKEAIDRQKEAINAALRVGIDTKELENELSQMR